jgi:DNA integrity scanning protein DisA with diadenylate cyclase activity
VTEVESALEEMVITDLVRLTDGVRPKALECAIAIACRIGQAARRGKRIGAILMLGDSLKVLEGSRQLIPNPFEGHDNATRALTNPGIHDALVELSKLDGAFVIRGDGFIQTAGAFLAVADIDIELPIGLGARHAAAAITTARTDATGIVVSATDGNVRVFSGGRMVLRMDPDIEHGPVHTAEQANLG